MMRLYIAPKKKKSTKTWISPAAQTRKSHSFETCHFRQDEGEVQERVAARCSVRAKDSGKSSSM